jgi:hypothetical protein
VLHRANVGQHSVNFRLLLLHCFARRPIILAYKAHVIVTFDQPVFCTCRVRFCIVCITYQHASSLQCAMMVHADTCACMHASALV